MSADICINAVSGPAVRCEKGLNEPVPLTLPLPGQYQKIRFENCDTKETRAKLLLKPPGQGFAGNALWLWSSDNGYDVLNFRTYSEEGPKEGKVSLKDPKNFPNPSRKILPLRTHANWQVLCVTTMNDPDRPQPRQKGFYEISYVENLSGTDIPEHPRSYKVELRAPAEEEALTIKNARGQSVFIQLMRSDDKVSGPLLYIMSPQPFALGKYFVAGRQVRNFRHGLVYSGLFDLRDKNDFDFDNPAIRIVPNTNDQTFFITTVRTAGLTR